MKKPFPLLFFCFCFLFFNALHAQQARFTRMINEKEARLGTIYGIQQDHQGYIWVLTGDRGIARYDGRQLVSFRHDIENPNSLTSGFLADICIDSADRIWIAAFGTGLDLFDRATNTFTHFRHNPKDSTSLFNDTLTSIMVDRSGTLWIGSYNVLERFDFATKKFTHFFPDSTKGKPPVMGPITQIYEDKSGVMWLGAGEPFGGKPEDPGGLFRFDRSTGKFVRFAHEANNAASLENNMVTSIFEDSKGNFWVGTKGNGLHQMDRSSGKFTHFYYDSTQPQKLARPPIGIEPFELIPFITEDANGKIWISSIFGGINRYDPDSQKVTHFGSMGDEKKKAKFAKDTLTGFIDFGSYRPLHAKDGLLWMTGFPNNAYTLTYGRKSIPHFANNSSVNSFYAEPAGNTLWFGTDDGLAQKDLKTGKIKLWSHDPHNNNSLNSNSVVAIRADEQGKLWLATHQGGLDQFDPKTGTFIHYHHDSSKAGSLGMDSLHCIFIEDANTMWVGAENGLTKMDRKTGLFTTYRHNADTNSIRDASVYVLIKDSARKVWIATSGGLEQFDSKSGHFYHYLKDMHIRALCIDRSGKLWAGGTEGLYSYNPQKDAFVLFTNEAFPSSIESILSILEDNDGNFWITTTDAIMKMNLAHDEIKIYSAPYGVETSNWNWLDNFKTPDGKIYIGNGKGYFAFYPSEVSDTRVPPVLNFTKFNIEQKTITVGPGSILLAPIWKTEKIILPFNENTFSIEYNAVDFSTGGDLKYTYRLEPYQQTWQPLSTEHQASFFNLPHGTYTFRIKAINSEGVVAEKSIMIVINPPWWKTWWAYLLYALLLILAGWAIYKYQRRYILKAERKRAQEKELAQAKEIEKAYTDLQATQALLIQSEKMASLGELTAGIAHEIQNPLNFVNNFSEINAELLTELRNELAKGNTEEVNTIAKDLEQNMGKITEHGKRADAIVKSMLQHSRSSSGARESTDVNALADEWLRLAYHGLRSKDKSFNCTLDIRLDPQLPAIPMIRQDIGRVLLNLYNNAFYAVNEKKKQQPTGLPVGQAGLPAGQAGYDPTISVVTRKVNEQVEIEVSDNGAGMPQKIVDKIFQPFFTTKPTGQGTGLGLSLSYDIIKAHGGNIIVHTTEGQGTSFTIQLPAK